MAGSDENQILFCLLKDGGDEMTTKTIQCSVSALQDAALKNQVVLLLSVWASGRRPSDAMMAASDWLATFSDNTATIRSLSQKGQQALASLTLAS